MEMNRTETIKAMMNILSKYEYREGHNYSPTEYGCGKIFDTEMRNKGELISHLEKHPCYNGKGQIVLTEKFGRDRDNNIIEEFIDFLYNNTKVNHVFQAGEVVRVKEEFEKPGNWVCYMDKYIGKEVITVTDDGDDIYCYLANDPDSQRWWFKDYTLEKLDGTPYTFGQSDSVFTHLDFRHLREIIREVGQYLTDDETEAVNEYFPFVKAHNGAKTSRVVKKICNYYGISKDPEWNHFYTRFADAINPLEVETWTIISWNPVDYYMMSHGNSWTSCHHIDKTDLDRIYNGNYHGCYSGGTQSYMDDPSTVEVYTVDRSYNGNEFELQPKTMRQMFHISPDGTSFVQGRLYPQDNDCGSKGKYDKLRAIMQRVISECYGTINYWSNKKGTGACCEVINTDPKSGHYRDYEYYDNCNVSFLKDGYTGAMIDVGHICICPHCGREHYSEECIQCDDCCNTVYCNNCGEEYSEDDGITTYDGNHYCCSSCAESDGYVYCENDEEWHYDNSEVIYDNYLDGYVYDYYENFVITADGNTYLDGYNAKWDGYVHCKNDDEWHKKEDCVYDDYLEEFMYDPNGDYVETTEGFTFINEDNARSAGCVYDEERNEWHAKREEGVA